MKKKRKRSYGYGRKEKINMQINPIIANEIRAASKVYFYLREHPQNQNGHIEAFDKTVAQNELGLLPVDFEGAMVYLNNIKFITFTCIDDTYDITVYDKYADTEGK